MLVGCLVGLVGFVIIDLECIVERLCPESPLFESMQTAKLHEFNWTMTISVVGLVIFALSVQFYDDVRFLYFPFACVKLSSNSTKILCSLNNMVTMGANE